MGGVATFADFGIDLPGGRSGNVKTRCPQCSATRKHRYDKSLSVHVEKGTWKCHHCGWSGGLGGSVDWRDSLGRRETPKVWVKPKPIEVAPDLHPDIVAFFKSRGISIDVVRRNKVTGDGNGIQFPIYRDGELVNIKTRWRGKRFSMVSGAERVWYGLDDCATAEQVVIVEGELDKLAVETAGVVACLSVPDGAPAKGTTDYSSKFDFLASGAAIFDQCHTVILAVDNDEAGQTLETELARRIGRDKCFRVSWPDGCKDANDVLLAHGPSALRDHIANARPYPIDGVVMPDDLRRDLLSLYHNETPRGESTGWENLDALYTVKTGQMTIVTGIPGSGKSEWLDALMVNLSVASGWCFTVYSPENFPPQRHLQKWVEKYIGMPFGKGPSVRMGESDVNRAVDWCQDHVSFLNPDETTLEELLDLCSVQVFRFGVKGIVLDPWNEIDHSRPREMTETEFISRCLSRIRQFCRHYDVHAWVSAHPRMLRKDKDSNEYSVPTPYDIAGSAHWFNKADNCIAIWRHKTDDLKPIEVHVQKIRFREIGALGVAFLYYDKVTGRYKAPDGHHGFEFASTGR